MDIALILIIIIAIVLIYDNFTKREYATDTTDTTDDDDDDVTATLDFDSGTSGVSISLEQSDEVKEKVYDIVMEIRSNAKRLENSQNISRVKHLYKDGQMNKWLEDIFTLTDEIMIEDEYQPEEEEKPSQTSNNMFLMAQAIRGYGYMLQNVTTDAGIYDMGILIESRGTQLMHYLDYKT